MSKIYCYACCTDIDGTNYEQHILSCKIFYSQSTHENAHRSHMYLKDLTDILLNKIEQSEMINNWLINYAVNNFDDFYNIIDKFDIKQFEVDGPHELFVDNSNCSLDTGLYHIILVGEGGDIFGTSGEIKSYLLDVKNHYQSVLVLILIHLK